MRKTIPLLLIAAAAEELAVEAAAMSDEEGLA